MAKKTIRRRMAAPETLPPLPNLESLIQGDGSITLGRVSRTPCAATAATEDDSLTMLVRREGETLVQLLTRLDKAIELALEQQHFIDEVNNGPDYTI